MNEHLPSLNASQQAIRWLELLVLFVGGPIVLSVFPWILADGRLFLFLWVIAGLCLVYLFFDKGFERSRLWVSKQSSLPPATQGEPGRSRGWPRTRYFFNHFGWIAFRWVLLGVVIVFLYGLFAGQKVFGLRVPVEMFGLPRRMAGLFFMIAIFYPWVSVYPQNVIYRAFFCRRYGPILGAGWPMILVNAALFSFGHAMFGNWIVLALTAAGGVLFTRTYLKTRSLLLAVAEHALYGLLCFSIGVGIYLLYGAFS